MEWRGPSIRDCVYVGFGGHSVCKDCQRRWVYMASMLDRLVSSALLTSIRWAGNVLAVAGSQVVVLHKIEKGQERSYKLRGADVRHHHRLILS